MYVEMQSLNPFLEPRLPLLCPPAHKTTMNFSMNLVVLAMALLAGCASSFVVPTTLAASSTLTRTSSPVGCSRTVSVPTCVLDRLHRYREVCQDKPVSRNQRKG